MKYISVYLALFFALSTPMLAQGRPGPDPWAYSPNSRWNPSWNQRPNPRRGACFFTTAPFRGNKFCVRAGDKLPYLPGDFGDNLSSIQTFGGARVRIFNDRNFRGGSTNVNRSIPDLRSLPFGPGHTWNNRVSSVMVF